MNCNQCQNDFDGLLDGRLDEPVVRAVQTHIASCSDCGRAWREHEAAWAAFAATPELEPSSNFVARVLIAIDAADREEPVSRWQIVWPRFLRLAAAGAATAIAVGIASLGLLHDQTSLAKFDPRLHHELLTELPVLQNLELLKDFDVIRNLDQLAPPVEMDEIDLMLQEILST